LVGKQVRDEFKKLLIVYYHAYELDAPLFIWIILFIWKKNV